MDRAFSPAAKATAEAMVRGIVAAFDARIAALDWMAPATKAEARRKLETLRVSVGYPDVWPTYDGLEIRADDAYGNAERLERYEYAQALATLRRPVDRDAWSMVPQQVNAVNMPAMNALNFPAAILQPPFFNPDRSDAMNYAAIGAVIGHEISHSFDNLGAGFDADGRLRNWWTPEDFAHFTAATTQLARQYDAYRPVPGPRRQRHADAHGEHRGPRGPHGRLRRVARLAQWRRGAGRRWVDGRRAVLPELRAGLADRPSATPRSGSASSRTATRPARTAPSRSATSTRGTKRFRSSPATRSTSPPTPASASGSGRSGV